MNQIKLNQWIIFHLVIFNPINKTTFNKKNYKLKLQNKQIKKIKYE